MPARRQTQRFATGPDFGRKGQRTPFGSSASRGGHRRIGGDHGRRVAIERGDQRRHRLQDRMAAEMQAHPGVELTQTFDRHVAGEVAADRTHKRQSLAQVRGSDQRRSDNGALRRSASRASYTAMVAASCTNTPGCRLVPELSQIT